VGLVLEVDTVVLSSVVATDGLLFVACSIAAPISGPNSGRAMATASRISLFASGATSDTPTAMHRYSGGTARQTAKTILPACDGAAAAAALAIAQACLGCSSAAVPAATGAIGPTARAMAPTIEGAAAGLIPSAVLTTFMVVVSRSRGLASAISWAALAGSSAAGTLLKVFFSEAACAEWDAPRQTRLRPIIAICFIRHGCNSRNRARRL